VNSEELEPLASRSGIVPVAYKKKKKKMLAACDLFRKVYIHTHTHTHT
jgi:hypothetical protein